MAATTTATLSAQKIVRSEHLGGRNLVVFIVLLALVALLPLVTSIPNGLSSGSVSRSRERSARNQLTHAPRTRHSSPSSAAGSSSSDDYGDQPSQGQGHYRRFGGSSDINSDYYNGDTDETADYAADNADNDIDETIDGRVPPENCTHCVARLGKRDYRLESIKAEILRKLRLTQPPNVTMPRLPEIPYIKRMVDDWNYQSDAPLNDNTVELTDDYHATTMKLLLFPTAATGPNSHSTIVFRINPDIRKDDVSQATLGIFLRRYPNTQYSSSQRTMLLIYRLKQADGGFERILATRKTIYYNPYNLNKWYQFNLKTVVKEWIEDPSSNFGLEINIGDPSGNPLAVLNPTNAADEPFRPYLEIFVEEQQQNSRSKRMANLDCDEFSAERRCCRYPLQVNFASFGWDWVIVPRQYSAYYCAGECPFLHFQSQSGASGSHIRQQVTSSSCCSPKRVSPISMLYYDENMNIVYGKLPGMVVDQCGCS